MILKVPLSFRSTTGRMTQRWFHSSPLVRQAAPAVAASSPAWSGKFTFASPESDFTSTVVSANGATLEAEWSQQLSLASPESDFSSAPPQQQHDNNDCHSNDRQALLLDQMLHQWQISSPESALGATHVRETMSAATEQQFVSILEQHGLPTTSPLAVAEDHTVGNKSPNTSLLLEDAAPFFVASPESALGLAHGGEFLSREEDQQAVPAEGGSFESPTNMVPTTAPEDDRIHLLWENSWLRASPESATGYVPVAETMTTEEHHQFLSSRPAPLPTTLAQALTDPHHRALVVTTTTHPFRVVHVNEVWEGLCGYKKAEALHQPIGTLLKGDLQAQHQSTSLSRMVHDLHTVPTKTHDLRGLVNYTKAGRPFRNHLQVGPLFRPTSTSTSSRSDSDGQHPPVVEYFVGILNEEVADEDQTRQQQQQMAA